jgi:hypothetical protein
MLQTIAPMPYVALQQAFDEGSPEGERYYWKSHYLAGLPDEAIDVLVERADPLSGPLALMATHHPEPG